MKKQGTVCFIVENSKVLLVEIKYQDGRKLWNGIGGVVDSGETTQEAVVREIVEETKIIIDKADLAEVKTIDVGEYDLHIFVATKWSGILEAIDPTLGEFRWFDFAHVPYGKMHEDNDKWLPEILKNF